MIFVYVKNQFEGWMVVRVMVYRGGENSELLELRTSRCGGFIKVLQKNFFFKKRTFLRKNENFSAIYGFSTFIGTALRVLGADVFFWSAPRKFEKKT